MDFPRQITHPFREGCAYFVTWRLAGSLPAVKTADVWTYDGPKFVEFDRLPDAVSTGPKWLERADIANIVVNSLQSGERESRYR